MHVTVLNLVLIVFILLNTQFKTLHAQGFLFSESNRNSYIQKANEIKLWQSEEWIRLGHYEKKINGHYESSFRGPMFIHDSGYQSPEDELEATLNAFFNESKELTSKYRRHPQCQFLARRKWLSQQLRFQTNELLPCEERKEWKAQLNAQSVSLIFAASDLGNASSSYGHTFLKLINPQNAKNKDLIDYGLNYAANTDSSTGLFYALKGLFGMYGGTFTMLPYHQKIREYINLEGRDIWEYPLSLSPDEVDFLIDHILEMENSSAPYFFFTDNCSYHILKALEVVKPELNLTKHFSRFVIPIDTVKVLRRYTKLSDQRIFKKSLKTDYLDSFSKLSLFQKNALDEAVIKYEISEKSELTKKEKAEVYETAMKYLAVKSYRTGQDLDHEIYKLSSERALLGNMTTENKLSQIQAPDESHDSSSIYLGYGQHNLKEGEPASNFYSFKFKSAFHDLEQPDFGTVHMSQTEMAGIDFRYEEENKKILLYRFTLLNLINLNPVTQLDKNFSWKVRFDIMDQWSPDLEAGGGLSFNLKLGESARLSYFFTGRSWKTQSDTKTFNNGLGPEVHFVLRPTHSIGFSLSATYFGILNKIPFLRLKSKLNFNIEQNFDLQLEAENNEDKAYEAQVRLVKSFIF